MKLILASSKDKAAKNIAAQLLEFYDFERTSGPEVDYIFNNVGMVMTDKETTKLTTLSLKADEVIVASRHASATGRPSFTVHVPGELELHKMALASPPTIKSALVSLVAARDELELPHSVSLESTHHGPSNLDIPVTFVEIGSTMEEWSNQRAGEIVAHAIMKAAISPAKCSNAVGLGGPHYAPRHTEITLHTNLGIGHILPKYLKFDEKLIELAVSRTRGLAQFLALDWKGLSTERRAICQKTADRLGIRAERSKDIITQEKL